MHRSSLVESLCSAAMLPVNAAPVHLVDELPTQISEPEPGVFLVDFGRVAFGNVRLMPPAGATNSITVHFGEDFKNGRLNRTPPGTVRYSSTTVVLNCDIPLVVAPPADTRNTQPPAVLPPSEWDVVLPFRWIEIEGWPGILCPDNIVRQAAFASDWDDDAAAFESSDAMLNRIWELCRYAIKATTFCGVYVDGDRERIAYEADAYINQLCHYAADNNIQMARDTFDHLMTHPTWPTEWASHMVFMAYADWMQSGDIQWLKARYESLKTKLLLDRVGPDELITSDATQIERTDIVDWPTEERDGYVFTRVNTVVNAFHLRALEQMATLAHAIGNHADADDFEKRIRSTYAVFQETLFDSTDGRYRDGINTEHSAQHANLFPLAFGLVPEADRQGMAERLGEQGMRCSVYAAQYLLEGLFENGADEQALALITAPGDRSWRHMVESGATLTWEAWDMKFKPNQDWNHAWGAAPGNLLPRFVLGAQPLTPGWETARIRPPLGKLEHAKGKIPTPRGPILIDWQNAHTFTLSLTLPKGMRARIELPALPSSRGVFREGKLVKAQRIGNRWVLAEEVSGVLMLEVK